MKTPDFTPFQVLAPKGTTNEDASAGSPRDVVEKIVQPTMGVTVSCGNKIFSTTFTPFDFFFSTSFKKCVLFGKFVLFFVFFCVVLCCLARSA